MTTNTNTTNTTRTQQRAICPACFAEQAVNANGRLAQHGYTRPQMWNQNVGTCSGASHSHFGTEGGRNYTTNLANDLRERAAKLDAQAARVVSGDADVYKSKRVTNTRYTTMVVVENPTDAQRAQYAQSLRQQSAQMLAHAVDLDARVAAWVAAAPRSVTVATKVHVVHFRAIGRWCGGKFCARSAMGARRGMTSATLADVNCSKCLSLHRVWESKQTTGSAR